MASLFLDGNLSELKSELPRLITNFVETSSEQNHLSEAFMRTILALDLQMAIDLEEFLQKQNLQMSCLTLLIRVRCCANSEERMRLALQSGRLELLDYLYYYCGCRLPSDGYETAILYNQTNSLVFTIRNTVFQSGDVKVCSFAARSGRFECLALARSYGCLWKNESICEEAASSGNLDCLRYVHLLQGQLCAKTCIAAALGGHTNCLEYIRDAATGRDLLVQCSAAVLRSAARNGHLDTIRFLHEQCGCQSWSSHVAAAAAQGGHTECLEYAHQHGCPWGTATCLRAAENNHFHCLAYALQHACPFDFDAGEAAARRGYVDCLELLLQEELCPDEAACRIAATHGHVVCMRMLQRFDHDHSIWSPEVAYEAAANGHVWCLHFAISNGCLINFQRCLRSAQQNQHWHCVRFIEQAELCPLWSG